MPTLTRWFIKTSFVYLIAALIVGLLLAAAPIVSLPPIVTGLNPVYFHLFMVGWVTQIIFGVAYWMFPVLNRETPRGSQWLSWAAYVLLNAGLLLRIVAEPVLSVEHTTFWGALLAVSSVLQWFGGAAFVANTWGRIKER